jgi:GTP-binding protein EngB required for normal cell division
LCLVFNKADKVKKGRVDGRIAGILSELEADPSAVVLTFSSVTGEGRKQLWGWISDALGL